MPTLEQMKKAIGELVVAKGFGNSPDDFSSKLLFSFIELGEAGDLWKKGANAIGTSHHNFKTLDDVRAGTVEELIDAMFYIIDAARVAYPEYNLDEVFEKKLAKNWGRPYRYGEDSTNVKHASARSVETQSPQV